MDKEKQDGFVIGGETEDNNGYGSSAYPSYGNVSTSEDVPEAGHSETASYYESSARKPRSIRIGLPVG